MKLEIKTLNDTGAAARTFIRDVLLPRRGKPGGGLVFAFHGPMGSGKTTLIKAICEELGVEDMINSPTFAIINEYRNAKTGGLIYHFDFYRINRLREAEDIGAGEYFYSGFPCFIEWPEKAEDLLPPDTVHVCIEENAGGSRTVTIDASL